MPRASPAWGLCTTMAKACPRTTHKRQPGIARRLSRATPGAIHPWVFVRQGPRCAPGLRASGAWFRKAAEQGDAKAQFELGVCTTTARVCPRTTLKRRVGIARRLSRATPRRNTSSGLYHAARAVPQDYTQAAAWYRKAAEQGDAQAQQRPRGFVPQGQGVPQDYAEAYFWFDLAAAGKLDASLAEQAAKHRDEAASHLTPADLSREQERARKWFEAHQAKPQ